MTIFYKKNTGSNVEQIKKKYWIKKTVTLLVYVFKNEY